MERETIQSNPASSVRRRNPVVTMAAHEHHRAAAASTLAIFALLPFIGECVY